MDFMTDEELDDYLILVLFMLKKEKLLPPEKSKWFWVGEIFQKRALYGRYDTMNWKMEMGNSIWSKFFKWHFRSKKWR